MACKKPKTINATLGPLIAIRAILSWCEGQLLLNEAPNGLINPRSRQPLVHTGSRSEDPTPVEKTLRVILGLDLQQAAEVVLAPDLARETEGREVVGVVVYGGLAGGLLEVAQVGHHVVLLAVIHESLVGVVGPLG